MCGAFLSVKRPTATKVFSEKTGCTSKNSGANDPKGRLQEYISRSFAVSRLEDRESLMEYLTGDARKRLMLWSDEQFASAFIDSKRQFVKLLFPELRMKSENEAEITYEITYFDQGRGHDAKVTNRKLCQMVRDKGQWFIQDVHNIKELIEYRNELTIP